MPDKVKKKINYGYLNRTEVEQLTISTGQSIVTCQQDTKSSSELAIIQQIFAILNHSHLSRQAIQTVSLKKKTTGFRILLLQYTYIVQKVLDVETDPRNPTKEAKRLRSKPTPEYRFWTRLEENCVPYLASVVDLDGLAVQQIDSDPLQ
jgi:hypothetical protein